MMTLQPGHVYHGSAYTLGLELEAESVDLIFTDPVYEDMAAYAWLSRFAARVLKPGGSLIAFCAIGLLPETFGALQNPLLTYRWEFTSAWNGGAGRAPFGFCKQARGLWYSKGPATPSKKIVDVLVGVNGRSKFPRILDDNLGAGSWTKIPDHMAYWIAAFLPPGGRLVDPFAGWGTIPAVATALGYNNWIGFELEEARAWFAQERVDRVRPLLVPVQERLLP